MQLSDTDMYTYKVHKNIQSNVNRPHTGLRHAWQWLNDLRMYTNSIWIFWRCTWILKARSRLSKVTDQTGQTDRHNWTYYHSAFAGDNNNIIRSFIVNVATMTVISHVVITKCLKILSLRYTSWCISQTRSSTVPEKLPISLQNSHLVIVSFNTPLNKL